MQRNPLYQIYPEKAVFESLFHGLGKWEPKPGLTHRLGHIYLRSVVRGIRYFFGINLV